MVFVSYSINVSVSGGPNISVSSGNIEAEAIDRVAVSIASGDSEMTVDIQPALADQIHFILVESDIYNPDLTIKFSDGTSDSPELTLDAPQLLTNGMMGMLAGINPTQLKLNLGGTDLNANVSIFVARDATPP